jgi:hypothetical protein
MAFWVLHGLINSENTNFDTLHKTVKRSQASLEKASCLHLRDRYILKLARCEWCSLTPWYYAACCP